MNGKLVGFLIVGTALVAGAMMYYLQVYHFYEPVDLELEQIHLTPVQGGMAQPIPVEDLEAIDAMSSPIRYRSCFTLDLSQALLSETYQLAEDPEPLVAPGWFDCFDAAEIGAALESGEALAFLGVSEVAQGVDRIVAVFPDGRGYAWNQLNDTFAE